MKTQLRRLLGWVFIFMAPVFMYASIHGLHNQTELNNPSKVSYTYADVLATRQFPRHFEARYRFQEKRGGSWFSGTDSLGRKNLWEIISLHDWKNLNNGSKTIKVKYLTANPSINIPADTAGNGFADTIGGMVFSIIIFLLGIYTVSKLSNRHASPRVKLTRPNGDPIVATLLAKGSGMCTQRQGEVKNKQFPRIPATFVVCQIAGVLALLPVLAYIRGGTLRARAMSLLPYLANPSWVWVELAVAVLFLSIGAGALFASVRKRRNDRAVVQ